MSCWAISICRNSSQQRSRSKPVANLRVEACCGFLLNGVQDLTIFQGLTASTARFGLPAIRPGFATRRGVRWQFLAVPIRWFAAPYPACAGLPEVTWDNRVSVALADEGAPLAVLLTYGAEMRGSTRIEFQQIFAILLPVAARPSKSTEPRMLAAARNLGSIARTE